MYVTTTVRESDGSCWIVVQRTNGVLDAAAAYLAENYCDHGAGRCLLDPPRWAWWTGLGNPLWSLGQRIINRGSGLTEVRRIEVTADVLVDQFGWDSETLVDDWLDRLG